MKRKKCNGKLVMYELRNLGGNPFTAFFGIIFPAIMLMIITSAMKAEVPKTMLAAANTEVFITISLIIPMAVVLLGYSANYSQELEKEIPIRMRLFGFQERSIMAAKVIAQIIVLTMGLIVYTILSYLVLDLQVPKFSSALILIFSQYLLGILFFGFAHGISGIFKKFGPTYAIVMGLYFGAMILCGMMGVKPEQLPKAARYISKMLPMSYISSDYIDFWQGGSYNFGPVIQSFLFLAAVCGIILMYANHKNRRVTN